MHRLILGALVSGFLLAGPAQAQNPPAQDPATLLRFWYQRFLDRGVDSAGWNWLGDIQRGKAPAEVLAEIIGSREYYQRAGSTPQGFIRALIVDLTGQEPSPQELQDLVRQVRADNRKDIALALMKRYPKAWRHPEPPERDYLAGVGEVLDRLTSEIQRLQEDIVGEFNNRKERDLYQRADATLVEIRQFQRSLRAGYDRKHLYQAFTQMDEKLHGLVDAVRDQGRDNAALARTLHRIQQADHQLHYQLSFGDTSEERGGQVIQRQAQALAGEARELQRTVQYAVANIREGAQLEKDIVAFSSAAEHFAKSLQKGVNREHLQRDFAIVDKSWVQVAEGINQLPAAQGNTYLRTQARRADTVFDQLYHQMGLKGDRTRIVSPLHRPD